LHLYNNLISLSFLVTYCDTMSFSLIRIQWVAATKVVKTLDANLHAFLSCSNTPTSDVERNRYAAAFPDPFLTS
jgi:hypothetical protein